MTYEKPREWGSGNYVTHVYAVQARATFGEIVLSLSPHGNQTGHQILTPEKWVRIHPERAPIGVPSGMDGLYQEAGQHGFLTYAAATAIAAWIQAEHNHGGIETRLVQIEFSCSYSTKELGRSEPVNLWEDDRQLVWKLKKERETEAVGRPKG